MVFLSLLLTRHQVTGVTGWSNLSQRPDWPQNIHTSLLYTAQCTLCTLHCAHRTLLHIFPHCTLKSTFFLQLPPCYILPVTSWKSRSGVPLAGQFPAKSHLPANKLQQRQTPHFAKNSPLPGQPKIPNFRYLLQKWGMSWPI